MQLLSRAMMLAGWRMRWEAPLSGVRLSVVQLSVVQLSVVQLSVVQLSVVLLSVVLLACGPPAEPAREAPRVVAEAPRAEPSTWPTSLPRGLLLACSQTISVDGAERPGPAHLELVVRAGGAWRIESVEDPSSNVFHKAMFFDPPGDAAPGILTVGGMAPALRLWRRDASGAFAAETLWGPTSERALIRLRDMEVARIGEHEGIVVGTHTEGAVALVSVQIDGEVEVSELGRQANTFVHEIEVGDLNGDGVLEVYASRSAPTALAAGLPQRGDVVRYAGGDASVVASLGARHAKEILVADVDMDGRDELYVVVEGRGDVEILRFDEGTPPDAGVRIATLPDRMTRFLTAGDLDGDGRRELVAAGFRSGLWLLRPSRAGAWSRERIDEDSAGFEHAALLTDLDGDGVDELYVAADEQAELRRYVWRDGGPRRELISRHPSAAHRITWNITAFEVESL